MTRVLLIILYSTSFYAQSNLNIKTNLILEEIYFWDQDYRRSKSKCSYSEIYQRDSINLSYVNHIISYYGFPLNKDSFSLDAFNGIYYTIQHSDLATQKKYLPQIKEWADQGIISQKKYAMTYDRVLVRSTGQQKYGEQRYHDTIGNYLKYYPFISIDSVQIFRQELGLAPIDLNKKTVLIKK